MARGGGRGGKVPDRKTIKTKKISSKVCKASLPSKNSKRGRPSKNTPSPTPGTSKSKSAPTPIPSTSKSKSTPNPSTSKSASEKAVRGKRKSAVNNPLIEQYNQEKKEFQSKAPPAKKIKLMGTSTPTQKKTAIKKDEAKSMPSQEKIVIIKIQNDAPKIEDIPNISSNQEPVDEDVDSMDDSITAITVTKEDSTVLAVSAVVKMENYEQQCDKQEKKERDIKSEENSMGQVKEEITTERDTFENQIDEIDFNEHVEEEEMPLKITDVYEFKDSMEIDSDHEHNFSIEDVEKNTKQKMQKNFIG